MDKILEGYLEELHQMESLIFDFEGKVC